MEPCWGRGQGQLGVFETKTETEIETKQKGKWGSQKEGKTWSQRSQGRGGEGVSLTLRVPGQGPSSLSWVRISEPSLGLVPPQLAPAWGGMG